MFVHGIDVEQVVLHLADDLAERREIGAEHAIDVHAPEFVGDAARLAQDIHEQFPAARVAPEFGVDARETGAQQADGVGAHALQFRMLLENQKQFEHGLRPLLEELIVGDIEEAGARIEARVDALAAEPAQLEHGLLKMLEQYLVEQGQVLAWPRNLLPGLFQQHPQLQANVLEVVGAHARETLDRFRELASEPVPQRLARALLRLLPLGDECCADGIFLAGITQQQLADIAATTLYTVSRVLSQWQNEGLLTTGRGKIRIRSRSRLSELAEAVVLAR